MEHVLRDMFILGSPFLETILRPIFVYLFLAVALRLAGKRELAQINSFDLVVLLTISNLLQNAGIGSETSVLGGWISSASLLAMNYLVIRVLFRHPKVGRFLQGNTTVLIEDGHFVYDNLRKEFINPDDLLATIHAQGVEDVREVHRCEIAPNGTIAVVQKHPTELERLQNEEEAVLGRLDEIARRLSVIEQHLQGGRA